MAKINREIPLEHLKMEKRVMRWLYGLGYTFEEIQKFSWRDVDEFEKKLRMNREVFFIKYDPTTGKMDVEKGNKYIELPIEDEEIANFFRYSRIYCHWCFVCKKPLSWRREKSLDALFPLCKIEEICAGEDKNHTLNALTNNLEFDSIKLSKENIENTKTKELAKGEAVQGIITWQNIGLHV